MNRFFKVPDAVGLLGRSLVPRFFLLFFTIQPVRHGQVSCFAICKVSSKSSVGPTLELTRADEQHSIYAARRNDESHAIEASRLNELLDRLYCGMTLSE